MERFALDSVRVCCYEIEVGLYARADHVDCKMWRCPDPRESPQVLRECDHDLKRSIEFLLPPDAVEMNREEDEGDSHAGLAR